MVRNKKKTSGRVTTIAGIVICVLLSPVLILNIILIAQGFGGDKSRLPDICGLFPLMVRSGSMSGSIETGDLLIVHTVDSPEKMSKGDIVTYWDGEPGGALVTHRIISVTSDKDNKLVYRTKGDANPTEDTAYLYPEKIVGSYVARIPFLGNVAMFMQTIPGIIVCVVLPLSAFVVYDIIKRRRTEKNNRKETAVLMAELEELKKLRTLQNLVEEATAVSQPENDVNIKQL